jgi:acetate kinase
VADAILILNAGSSSLKFSVYADAGAPRPLVRGQFEGLFSQPHFEAFGYDGKLLDERHWPAASSLSHQDAVAYLLDWGRQGAFAEHRVIAAGHRVVHGGMKLVRPVLIDVQVLEELDSLVPLAPLHQAHNVAAIRAVQQVAPRLPQVACFDTSFHRTQPIVAQMFGLPRGYFEQGIRRYGFHGLSYEYIGSVLPTYDAAAAAGRTVVAHLGNGASMCAMRGGRSVSTTMGFTAVDGLLMGTRCGALDPGVLLYLMEQQGKTGRELESLIYQESGLLGVSGISADMRTLLASDDPRAAEAIALFVYRIVCSLGSLATALGGLDSIVFTGGIGEHASAIREEVCRQASWLGVQLDDDANQHDGPMISAPESPVSAWVIPTNEELMVARHVQSVLAEHQFTRG